MSHVCRYPQVPEEGIGASGARVTDDCELPMWALGSRLTSSGRAAHTLDSRTTWLLSSANSLKMLFSFLKVMIVPKEDIGT